MESVVYADIPVRYARLVAKFSETLRQARTARSWTQDQLEDLSGVSQSQISKFERDELRPGLDDLIGFARAFRISVEKLISGHDARYDLLCRSGDVELPSYVTGGIDVPATSDLQRRLGEAEATIEEVRTTAAQLLKLTLQLQLCAEGRTPSPAQTAGRKPARTVDRRPLSGNR